MKLAYLNTTGTFSGKLELPSFNPNFNQSNTRVKLNQKGEFYNGGKLIYTSTQVKQDNGNYYANFRGIPVVSTNAAIASPVLSEGTLTEFKYQGRLPVKMQGVIQDELSVVKVLYNGIALDPRDGKRYQGVFTVNGFSVRYDNAQTGKNPTVFDFKSDLPGSPSVKSVDVVDAPLFRLFILIDDSTAKQI